MYQLIHSLTTSELFKRQLPPFLVAFAVAELLYKFKSFALECAAFLVTWYVLDALAHALFPRRAEPTGSPPP
jgi:hypothetical protein